MKTLTGHLTATNKRHIKAIIDANLLEGRINKTSYFLSKKDDVFMVKIQCVDRGLIPCIGSPLRISTYTHTFTL